MSLPPFPTPSRDRISELLRVANEREELASKLLGPSRNLLELIQAAQGPLEHFQTLQRSGLLDEAQRMLDDTRRWRDLIEPNWLSAINDATLLVQQTELGSLDSLQSLSETLANHLQTTSDALQTNRAVIAAAMAAAPWQDQYQKFIDQLIPSLSLLRSAADHAFATEIATLKASAVESRAETLHFVWQQIVDVQALTEGLQSAEDSDALIDALAAVTSKIAAVVNKLGKNTVTEFRKMGLIGMLSFASAVVGIVVAVLPKEAPTELTAPERLAFNNLDAQVRTLHEDLRHLEEKTAAQDEAFLATLSRVELKGGAIIRAKPEKRAAKLLTVAEVTPVYTVSVRDGWEQVIYRDPLTLQLAQGWVSSRWVIRN